MQIIFIINKKVNFLQNKIIEKNLILTQNIKIS